MHPAWSLWTGQQQAIEATRSTLQNMWFHAPESVAHSMVRKGLDMLKLYRYAFDEYSNKKTVAADRLMHRTTQREVIPVKPIPILVVALSAVAVAGWFAASRFADEGGMPPATQAAQPSAPDPAVRPDAQARKKTAAPSAFPPPRWTPEVREALSLASASAMNGEHEKARKAIFRAVVLDRSMYHFSNLLANYYSDEGTERTGLSLYMVADRLGVGGADNMVRVLSRNFNKDELTEIEREAAQIEQEYYEIKNELRSQQL